jgi:hypothetical protein
VPFCRRILNCSALRSQHEDSRWDDRTVPTLVEHSLPLLISSLIGVSHVGG